MIIVPGRTGFIQILHHGFGANGDVGFTLNFAQGNLEGGTIFKSIPRTETVAQLGNATGLGSGRTIDFRDTMCEPSYKSLKTISGLAKPTSNHFLQFSLNFFNLFQFASCSFFLSPIFSLFLTVFLLTSFFFESCFSFEGIFSTYQPCTEEQYKDKS